MKLKFERGSKQPPRTGLLCCFSLQSDVEGTSALLSTARAESSGIQFWGEQHFYECSISLEWILMCAVVKTEHFVSAFELQHT